MTLKEARERFAVQGIDNTFFEGASSDQEEAFNNCVAFLEGVDKTKTIRCTRSSYGLKHVVEHAYRSCYVYEGTLILAALSLGFACLYADNKTMCCRFNMGNGSLKKRVAHFKENV